MYFYPFFGILLARLSRPCAQHVLGGGYHIGLDPVATPSARPTNSGWDITCCCTLIV